MRLFPVFAAFAVIAAIYGFVFERDRLLALVESARGDVAAAGEAGIEAAAEAPEPDAAAGAGKPVGVMAVHSTARMVDSAVILRGQTEADRQVDLRAETSGRVISTPLRKGALVEAGEVLCQLDPGTRAATLAETEARLAEARARVPEAEALVPEARARVEEARARVAEAEARLEEARINANAARKLRQDGFASETRVANTVAAVEGAKAGLVSAEAGRESARAGLESAAAGLETARAGVESARAAVAAAEEEIARLTITAPFAGLLESDTAELGSLLQPGGLCATVIQLDPVIVVGFVPETQVGRIALGARARAEMASGERVEGEVIFVSRSADPTTRTFRVEIEVPNPELALRDGQTAEIAVAAEGRRAHLLPQSALTLNDAGTLGVRVVTGRQTARFVPVALLRDAPEGVWLTGLPATADVIVIGQEYVTDGVRVAASFEETDQ